MFGFDSWVQPAIALLAALAAGAANTIAGGGSVISFPVLLWLGLPAEQASAMNTVGLWPGSVSGAWSYRARLATLEPKWGWLAVPALIGGGLGAWLLVNLPENWFDWVAPFMVIGASVLVAVEPLIRKRILSLLGMGGRGSKWAMVLVVLLVSAYGGYFGAGLGLLVLVSLALLGLENLHQANALKNVLAVGIKGVAVVYFIVIGLVDWPLALVMVGGSTIGGWGGGFLVREVEPEVLRWIIVGVGTIMGLITFVQTYF